MNARRSIRLATGLALSVVGVSSASAAATSNDSLSIEKSLGRWNISFSQSPVSLEIPDADSFKKMDMRAIGGPRYFYFVESHGITLSGWYEQGYRYKGLQGFWKSESARFYANPATAPTNVVFGKTNSWEVVLYDMPMPKNGIDVHLRAEFSQAGTWIDLHMSAGVVNTAAAETRQRLTALLEKIRVNVSPSAFVTPTELEAALLDLTDRIEDVDDRGYEKAVAIFSKHLLNLPANAFPITREARPWSGDPAASAEASPTSAAAMLDIAFLASIVRDDLHKTKHDQLYRAWLIVIKYYEHYTDASQTKGATWKKMPALDELVLKKKNGQLREYAATVPLLKK